MTYEKCHKSPVMSLTILKPNKDVRSSFLKIFNKNILLERIDIKEVFRSVSAKNAKSTLSIGRKCMLPN